MTMKCIASLPPSLPSSLVLCLTSSHVPGVRAVPDLQRSGQVPGVRDRGLRSEGCSRRSEPEGGTEGERQDPDDQQEISQEYRGVHRHSEEIQELR